MKKLSWIVIIVLMSCELIVDVDVPYEGDRIVLNGVQRTDYPWAVDVSRSTYVLDNSYRYGFPPLPEAEVTVFGDDGSVLNLVGDTLGYFKHDSYPLPGHRYKIVARANGLPEVHSEMVMPNPVKIKSVEWDSSRVSNDPNSYRADVTVNVTFDDPAEEKNYYAAFVEVSFTITYQRPTDPAPRTDSLTQRYEAQISDPAIATADEQKRRFSDGTFNGKTYTAPIRAQFYASPGYKFYRIDIQLVTISDECFRYEESKELYNATEGDPFAQPVQIYSNVENGFGVFAGTSADRKTYRLKP